MSSSKFVKFSKAESFKRQMWDGPYYICTICHRNFYQRPVKIFLQQNYQNYEIDYVSIISSDNACYICLTCHKYLLRNKTPCQAVCNKLEIGDIPQVFQDLRRLDKVLVSKRILFKKITIMHGKGEFSKIKANIINVPVDRKYLQYITKIM